MLRLRATGVGWTRTNPADLLGQHLNFLALRVLDKSRNGLSPGRPIAKGAEPWEVS